MFIIISVFSDTKYVGGSAFDSIQISSTGKNSHIEVEIKLYCRELFNKIVKWVQEKKPKMVITTNYIYADSTIKTVADGKITWHKKIRLYREKLDLGKLTVAHEYDIDPPLSPPLNAEIIRVKKRISRSINDWRIDCTWVGDENDLEIEAEYIGKDWRNAKKSIPKLRSFLESFESD